MFTEAITIIDESGFANPVGELSAKRPLTPPEVPGGYLQRPFLREELQMLLEFDTMAMIEMSDTPPDHAPPPLTLQELEEAYDRGDVLEGVFNEQNELIGYGWYEERNDELYLSSTAVHPNFRNNGLGSYFVRRVDFIARARGLSQSSLSVDPLNGRGLNVYFKHGYRITSYRTGYFGEESNTDRFIMVRDHMASQSPVFNSKLVISCDDTSGLSQAASDGFTGVALIRSESGDSRKNQILFTK